MQFDNNTLMLLGGAAVLFLFLRNQKSTPKPAVKDSIVEKLADQFIRDKSTPAGDGVNYTSEMNIPISVTVTPKQKAE